MALDAADQAASAAQQASDWCLGAMASSACTWVVNVIAGKTFLGLMGAAALFVLMPPGRPKEAPTTRVEIGREIAGRVFIAGLCSEIFGDWVVDVVAHLLPWSMAQAHPKPFYMLTGALGWYIGRAGALWIYKRKDKDAGEIVRDVKHDFGGDDDARQP